MDFAQIELVQVPDGNGGVQTVLAVKGTPIVGVDTVSLGGDQAGSFMDVRFRVFQIGATPEPTEPEPEPAE